MQSSLQSFHIDGTGSPIGDVGVEFAHGGGGVDAGNLASR